MQWFANCKHKLVKQDLFRAKAVNGRDMVITSPEVWNSQKFLGRRIAGFDRLLLARSRNSRPG
jgi:hypothetical protein